jgi:hypothetical protein
MARFSLRRQLGRQYVVYLVVGIIPLILYGFLFAGWLQHHYLQTAPTSKLADAIVGVILGSIFICFLGAMGLSILRSTQLRWQKHHPCFQPLRRHGPVAEVVTQIERELTDNVQVVVIGSVIQSLEFRFSAEGELGPDAVWLTPSWLIHVNRYGTNMDFIRLETLVVACREDRTLTLVDRFDVRLWIFGTPAGLTRLLTEIQARVPWALNQFDAETERRWADHRQEFVADVDQRREEIQGTRRPESYKPE